MSLSTQLTRGTLALPMLALFAALALVAGRTVEAHPANDPGLPAMPVEAEAEAPELALADGQHLVLDLRSVEAGCGAHARPQMLLANAPGDLGPIAQRGGCRTAG